MSLRNRFVLPVIAVSFLALLVGCGSGRNRATAPPTGGFSNTNLSGTYVFSTAGTDTSGVFIAITGTFTACGCAAGTISGGTLDVNDPLQGQLEGQPITGGSYFVGVDGRPGSTRGILTLQTSVAIFTFDYVLTSSTHGLITLYDSLNGTGSGTFDLQSTVSQANIDGHSYAFNVTGIGSFNGTTGAQTSYSAVGAFTLDANGSVGVTTTGVADTNNNGLIGCNQATGCTITNGSVDLSTVPGLATLTINSINYNFDVYPVSATHLKLIEIDTIPVMIGDAFTQSPSIPTGNNVFTVSGFDTIALGPFTAAGILDADGSGGINPDSVEDINDVGIATEVGSVTGGASIGGSYTAVTGGRSMITLTGFANGDNGGACSGCVFAAYPSTGGTQLLEIDNAGSTAGVAYAQSSNTTLASGQGYAMNLAGFNGVEEDDIAEFTNTNGAFSGLIDFNDGGGTTFGQTFTSAYSADSSVTGRGTVAPNANAFNLVTYVIDSSSAVFVEIDNNQVGLGSFVTQNAGAMSNMAAQHLTVMQLKAGPKGSLKRR
jgi:hypothetical protein